MTNWVRRNEGWLITLAVVALAAAMAYWRTISAFRAPYRILLDLPYPAWVDQLYTWRWVVRGSMFGAGGLLIAVEWLTRGVTLRLKAALSRPAWAIVVVAAIAIAGRSYLFPPGRLTLGDGLNNVAGALAIRVALERGVLPPYYWSNYAFMGSPWLQFHNAAYYYEGALFDLILREPFLSSKLALLLNHLLAAASMFLYVRYLTRSVWAGLVSATVWATTFFHYHYFVHVGSLHISALIPFMPAAVLCVEAILDGRRRRVALAGLALFVSLLLWAHAFYGAITTALLLLYSLVRTIALCWRRIGLQAGLIRLGMIFAGVAWGATAAASQWLPVLLERNLVSGWDPGGRFPHPIIDWRQALTFRGSFLTPDWWGGYVGQTVFALAMIGVVLSLVNRDWKMTGLIVWLAATAYLSLGPRYLPFDVIFQRIPFGNFVYAIRTPGKYLLFAEFSLAALSGVAFREVVLISYRLRRWVRRFPSPLFLGARRLSLLMSALVAGEMIFFSLQVNSLYPETYVNPFPGTKEYLGWLKENGDRTSRVIDGDLAVAVFSDQPSFAGHNEEAPPAAGLFLTALGGLQGDLKAGHIAPATRDMLYLLDVGYVVLREPPPADSGWKVGYDGGTLFSVWLVPLRSPIVAAPEARAFSSGSYPDVALAMGLDRERRTAAAIPLLQPEAASASEAGAPLQLALKDYQVRITTLTLDYEISRPAFLQLSYSAYPNVHVYLDGQEQDYFTTAFHLIGLATPAGAHRIEIRPSLSSLRVASYWLDAVGLGAILVVAAWEYRRARRANRRISERQLG